MNLRLDATVHDYREACAARFGVKNSPHRHKDNEAGIVPPHMSLRAKRSNPERAIARSLGGVASLAMATGPSDLSAIPRAGIRLRQAPHVSDAECGPRRRRSAMARANPPRAPTNFSVRRGVSSPPSIPIVPTAVIPAAMMPVMVVPIPIRLHDVCRRGGVLIHNASHRGR